MTECYIEEIMLEKTTEKKVKYDMLYPYTAIHYVISGSGYFNGNKLSAGTGFVTHKYERVSYYTNPNDPWTYLWIRIYGDDPKRYLKERGLTFMSESPYTFTFAKKDELLNLYGVYKSTLESLCDTKSFSAALLNLFLSLHGTKSDATSVTPKQNYLKNASEYIRQNYTRAISVDSISRQLGISRSYLRNIFYGAYGMSPQKYIINMRLGHAKDLLSKSTLSVSSVAEACGYPDILQFSKMFKKHTGVSPSYFRANYKPFPPELS